MPSKVAGRGTPRTTGQPTSGQLTSTGADLATSKAPAPSWKTTSARTRRPASSTVRSSTGPFGTNSSPKSGVPIRTMGSKTPDPAASSTVHRKATVFGAIPPSASVKSKVAVSVPPTSPASGATRREPSARLLAVAAAPATPGGSSIVTSSKISRSTFLTRSRPSGPY